MEPRRLRNENENENEKEVVDENENMVKNGESGASSNG